MSNEVGPFPTDEDLGLLSKQLDARICLMRDADATRRVRTFVIEPHNGELRGAQFVLSRREIVVPERREDGMDLTVRAGSMDPVLRAGILERILARFGVSKDNQIVRDDSFFGPHAFAAPGTGLTRIDFTLAGGGHYPATSFQVPEDLPPVTLLGSRTEFVLLEESPRQDFEFVLELGRDPLRTESRIALESVRNLWDKWLEAKPHVSSDSAALSDLVLVHAGRDVRGIVGLLRVASGDLVSYGLQIELRRPPLKGLRVLASTPEFDLRSRLEETDFPLLAGAAPDEGRMLIRLWPERSMLMTTRANLMGRLIGCLEPRFTLPPESEYTDGFVDIGPSQQLLARNIRIFLSHLSNRAS